MIEAWASSWFEARVWERVECGEVMLEAGVWERVEFGEVMVGARVRENV